MPAPVASAFSTLTELFVLDRPVDAEVDSVLTLLALVLMPDEADAESDATPLLVEDSPVERDPT